MDQQTQQTQETKPQESLTKAQMMSEEAKNPGAPATLVRIRAKEHISVTDFSTSKRGGMKIDLAPGEEAIVGESEAKDFCKPYSMKFSFGGERGEKDSPRHSRVRAERV